MDDLRYRPLRELDHDLDRGLDGGTGPRPGKSTLSSRLTPPARVTLLRVSDPAVARALGEGIGSGRRDDNGVAEDAERAVERAAATSGAPLPARLQRQFEESLGADLSRVRVHTDAVSGEAAHAVGAKAYTVGQDIHFGAGKYQPDDPFGMHLLAHEVAHTVQQSGGPARRQHKLEVSTPHDAAEHEADCAADAMVRGAPATVGGSGGVQRQIAREADPAAAGAAKKKAWVAGKIQFAKGPLRFTGSLDDTGKAQIAGAFQLPAPPIPLGPGITLNLTATIEASASGQVNDDGSMEAAVKTSLKARATINGGIPKLVSVYGGAELAVESSSAKVSRSAAGEWSASFSETLALTGKLVIGFDAEVLAEALPENWKGVLRLEYTPGGTVELLTYNVETGAFAAGADIAAIKAKILSIVGEVEGSERAYRQRGGGTIVSSPCEDSGGDGGAPPEGCPESPDQAPLMTPGDAPGTCDSETSSCEEDA